MSVDNERSDEREEVNLVLHVTIRTEIENVEPGTLRNYISTAEGRLRLVRAVEKFVERSGEVSFGWPTDNEEAFVTEVLAASAKVDE